MEIKQRACRQQNAILVSSNSADDALRIVQRGAICAKRLKLYLLLSVYKSISSRKKIYLLGTLKIPRRGRQRLKAMDGSMDAIGESQQCVLVVRVQHHLYYKAHMSTHVNHFTDGGSRELSESSVQVRSIHWFAQVLETWCCILTILS